MKPRYFINSVLRTSDKFKDFIAKVPDQATTLISKIKDQDFNIRNIHNDLQNLIVQFDKTSNNSGSIAGVLRNRNLMFTNTRSTGFNIPDSPITNTNAIITMLITMQ